MSFHKVTEFGLASCEEPEADIVHISKYKELKKRIAELENELKEAVRLVDASVDDALLREQIEDNQ